MPRSTCSMSFSCPAFGTKLAKTVMDASAMGRSPGQGRWTARDRTSAYLLTDVLRRLISRAMPKRKGPVRPGSPALPIDRGSSVPSYMQVAEHLRARIVGGEFRRGARMPADSELVAQSGLSRVTVRQGLSILVREGWLVRKQGLGTFVRHPIDQELTSVRTITEVLLSKGITPEIEVV